MAMAEKLLPLLLNFTERERGIVRRMAARDKVSETEYIRSAIVVDAVVCGDLKAMTLVGEKLRAKLIERLGLRGGGEPVKA
jgi:hypothetical protein